MTEGVDSPTDPAALQVQGLRVTFAAHDRTSPDVLAVDGIDLLAKEGEFLVLLGPSGCGKTTLMRLIAGLEQPTAGDIVIDGRVVTDLLGHDAAAMDHPVHRELLARAAVWSTGADRSEP